MTLQLLLASVGVPPARHACSSKIFGQAMSSALYYYPGNASAAAAAFMSSCAGTWSDHDLRRYLASNWKAGGPAGASCSDAQLFGAYHDGGKLVCRPRELFKQHCHVLSIGSDGDASFESSIHAFAPHCIVETHDGTLIGDRAKLRERLPSFVKLVPTNMDATTYLRLLQDGVEQLSLLKIDCEGCEFSSLLPLVSHICVDQIALELHACQSKGKRSREPTSSFPIGARHRPFDRAMRVHTLLSQLDVLYRIFEKQPNFVYSDGTCLEFSFIRRVPCVVRRGGAGI